MSSMGTLGKKTCQEMSPSHRRGGVRVQPQSTSFTSRFMLFKELTALPSLCCFMRMGYGFSPLTEDGTEAQ